MGFILNLLTWILQNVLKSYLSMFILFFFAKDIFSIPIQNGKFMYNSTGRYKLDLRFYPVHVQINDECK